MEWALRGQRGGVTVGDVAVEVYSSVLISQFNRPLWLLSSVWAEWCTCVDVLIQPASVVVELSGTVVLIFNPTGHLLFLIGLSLFSLPDSFLF